MQTGTIKKLVEGKGFGFIQAKGQKDIFFHHSACEAGVYESLEEGDSLQFEVEETDKGLKAVKVRLVL